MREDYIKCVNLVNTIGGSWCGGNQAGRFVDVDHAALNGRNEGRLVVCPECREAIIKALNNGVDDE